MPGLRYVPALIPDLSERKRPIVKKSLCALILVLTLVLGCLAPGLAEEAPAQETRLTQYFMPFTGQIEEHMDATADVLSYMDPSDDLYLEFRGVAGLEGTIEANWYKGKACDLYVVYDKQTGEVFAYAYTMTLPTSQRTQWAGVWNEYFPNMIAAIGSAVFIDCDHNNDVYGQRLDEFSAALDVPAIQKAMIRLDGTTTAPYFGHYISAFQAYEDDSTDRYWFVFHNTPEGSERPAAPEQPADEPAEQPVEEPVEQPAEEPVEQPAEESVEQPAEEPVEQPAAPAQTGAWKCPNCGATNSGASCLVCGTARPDGESAVAVSLPMPEGLEQYTEAFEGTAEEFCTALAEYVPGCTVTVKDSGVIADGLVWDRVTITNQEGQGGDIYMLRSEDGQKVFAQMCAEKVPAVYEDLGSVIAGTYIPSTASGIAYYTARAEMHNAELTDGLPIHYSPSEAQAVVGKMIEISLGEVGTKVETPLFEHSSCVRSEPFSEEENLVWYIYYVGADENPLLVPEFAANLTAPFKGSLDSTRAALRAWATTFIQKNSTFDIVETGAAGENAWERVRCENEDGGIDMYLILDPTLTSVVGFAWPFTMEAQSGSAVPIFMETAVQMDSGFDGTFEDAASGRGYPDKGEYRRSIDQEAEFDAFEEAFHAIEDDASFTQASVRFFGHNATLMRDPTHPDTYWYFYHNTAVDGLDEVGPDIVAAAPSAPSGPWQCRSCGATNSGANCLVCGAARPTGDEPEPEPEPELPPVLELDANGNWKCPNCGATNSGLSCLLCGTARPDPAAPESANWKCPGCGAVNSGKSCLVCGTAKP